MALRAIVINLTGAYSGRLYLIYYLSKRLPLAYRALVAGDTLFWVLMAPCAIAKAFTMLNDVCIKLAIDWKVISYARSDSINCR